MSFEQKYLKVKVTFLENVLGMMPANKDIYSEFIASKAPDAMSRAEEVEAFGIDEVERKEMTIFPRDAQGRPFFYDMEFRRKGYETKQNEMELNRIEWTMKRKSQAK